MRMEYAGAYVVRGGANALDAVLLKLAKEKAVERDSPDLFVKSYRSFGVEDAGELRGRVRSKPVRDAYRIFALFVPSMTSESQNALLKTLEEPAASAVFFLVTPSPETLLPTIRSRVQMLEIDSDEGELTADADVFLAASEERRLTMLKPLYEHEDEGRDIGAVIAFLQALERRFAAAKPSRERNRGIHAIYRARKYAADKGSLLKSLLEQVALLAPRL